MNSSSVCAQLWPNGSKVEEWFPNWFAGRYRFRRTVDLIVRFRTEFQFMASVLWMHAFDCLQMRRHYGTVTGLSPRLSASNCYDETPNHRWTPTDDGTILTCLLVEENFELFHRVVVQRLFDSGDGVSVGHLSVHETASTRLLHDFGPVVARDLAEGLRAVDDRIVDDLCIGQKETAVG